tara:strand:- start:200 stop:1174 length:975 start_codon:yes stop_codon:yes gene_type:complete
MIINTVNLFIFFSVYLLIFYGNAYSESFDDFKKSIIKEGIEFGVSKNILEENIETLNNVNKKVLKLYNNQPEFKITLNQYQKRNITTKRIEKGRKLQIQHNKILTKIKSKYNIPPEIIVSIWALESNYGNYTGTFNIIDSLATLAYKSKRKKFFKKELFNALKILEYKHIDSDSLKGSWAGAMGQSQFMPSSYLSYAVDFNNDKKIDIWNTHSDVFASIANYLKVHGWKKNKPWSLELKRMNNTEIDLKKSYSYKELKNKVVFLNQSEINISDETNIQIKSINSETLVENYLIFKNFFVLKKYNNSDFYALTVGKLANKIKLEK